MGYGRITEDLKHLGIEMSDGLGIFAIDLSAYFPYVDQKDLILRASLSTDKFAGGCPVINLHEECVLNHRYPNECWICMTMKNGRKRSKTGFLLQLPYEELNMFKYLNIEYGFEEDDMIRMCIPINVGVSEKAPCAGMEVHLLLKDPADPGLKIEVREKIDHGWCSFTYSMKVDDSSVNIERFGENRFARLVPYIDFDPVDDRNWIVFYETVSLIPCGLNDLVI